MPASIHFILGRAASGKSERVAAALARCMQEGRRAVLLVPEQFTYETERRLCHALGGLLGVQVLSFTRLCERALAVTALERGRPFLSAQGRCMVLRRSVWRMKNRLSVFAPVAGKPGFAQRVDALYAMCRRFALSPEDLQSAAAAMPEGDPLRDKLLDLSLLFADVREFLAGQYLDTEDAFDALREILPETFLAGARVYIDGFDLLTTQLYGVLEGIMGVAESLTLTVCMDADGAARDAAVFVPERQAYARLYAMAKGLGCPVTVERLPAPALQTPAAHLAREAFAQPPAVYPGEAGEVTVLCASSRAAEADALGDAILRLARQGVRYRDMAVIAGDMPAYAELVQRALSRREIPVFLDARREMRGHPAVELIGAAVLAAGEGFPATQVLRVAKTGLAGVGVDGCELMENHILAHGLKGGRQLSEPFCDAPEQAEQARAALIGPLAALRAGLQQEKTAGGKARALRAYLAALGVEAQLAAQAEQLRAEQRHALMQEHAQVWDIISELLEQLEGILGDVPMARGQFAAVLEEAFAAYQVGVIPATADQVLLGTVTRTRSRPVRALFVLGCNEGVLPAAHADDGLIDDLELAALRERGLAPWGDSAVRAQNEALDLYQALGKARERVYLSYACSDGKGELLPSSLIHTIKKIFPRCALRYAVDGEGEALPESREAGFAALIERLRVNMADTPAGRALLRYYRQDKDYAPRLKQALSYRSTPISPPAFGAAVARRVYGEGRFTSASRLETFNACPYQYFMKYGVRAYPRRELRARPEDVGSFCHLALERFGRAAQEAGWEALAPEEVERILDEVLPQCLAAYREGMLLATPRARAMATLWMDVVRQAAHAVARQLRAGAFRPVGYEVRFGPEEAFPAIPVTLPDGSRVGVTGVIDRVDAAQTPEGTMLRVVDYKTGHAEFSYEGLCAGIQLQLPLYLAAVQAAQAEARAGRLEDMLAGETPIPVGMFYQPVKDPSMQADTGEQAQRALRLTGMLLGSEECVAQTERGLSRFSEVVQGLERTREGVRGSALVDAPGLKRILRYAKRRAGETMAAVRSGEIAASPIEMGASYACAYCDYRSVCRFEAGVLGCRVRRKKGDALEVLQEE